MSDDLKQPDPRVYVPSITTGNTAERASLTGLELRRAACEALGWTLRADGVSFNPPDDYRVNGRRPVFMAPPRLEKLPAIESNPAVSEPLFLEWCEKRNFDFDLYGSRGKCKVYIYSGDRHKKTIETVAHGATPSEARARAIVEASRAK